MQIIWVLYIMYKSTACFLLEWNRLGYISNKAGQFPLFICNLIILPNIPFNPISHSLWVSNSGKTTLTLSVHSGAICVLEIELLQVTGDHKVY